MHSLPDRTSHHRYRCLGSRPISFQRERPFEKVSPLSGNRSFSTIPPSSTFSSLLFPHPSPPRSIPLFSLPPFPLFPDWIAALSGFFVNALRSADHPSVNWCTFLREQTFPPSILNRRLVVSCKLRLPLLGGRGGGGGEGYACTCAGVL